MPQMNFIEVKQLTKRVNMGSTVLTILDDITFQFPAGDTLSIVGVSGSGKSTLLGLLAGLDVPTVGEIRLNAQRIDHLNEDQRAKIRAKLIGFVFQDFQLLANLTAEENIALPMELNGFSKIRNRTQTLLKSVGLLDRATHYPKQLSGGEKQRIAIARAFSTEPKALFVDEPTGNLDEKTASHVIDLLFDLNQQKGTALVCVTHDPVLGSRCARSLNLSHGKLSS